MPARSRSRASARKTTKKPAKKAARKPTRKRAVKPPKKAQKKAFGRPGTAGKGEGDAAVKKWLAGVKPEHREMVARLDRIVSEEMPDVVKAVKWSTPLYGREGLGWIASVASFKNHVSLGFFAGTSLDPPPPYGESATMRRVNIRSAEEFEEKRYRSWVRQASKVKGWGTV